MDALTNFAISTVSAAPSPATSGTTLTTTANPWPAVPFNAVVWPAGAQPTASNGEIVRVTGNTAGALTIVRAQEGSSARTIVVGDQIQQAVTSGLLLEAAYAGGSIGPGLYGGCAWTADPTSLVSAATPTLGKIIFFRVKMAETKAITNVLFNVSTAGASLTFAKFAILTADGTTQLGITADLSTVINSTGVKTAALVTPTAVIAAGTEILIAFLQTGTTAAAFTSGGSSAMIAAGQSNTTPFRSAQTSASTSTSIALPLVFSGYSIYNNLMAILLT